MHQKHYCRSRRILSFQQKKKRKISSINKKIADENNNKKFVIWRTQTKLMMSTAQRSNLVWRTLPRTAPRSVQIVKFRCKFCVNLILHNAIAIAI